MKTFVKNYIGKGKKVEGLEIIKVSLKISEVLRFAHKYNGEDYISLEVAKLQNPDSFGHDHTIYVNRLEEKASEQSPSDARAKKQTKKTKKAETADAPF